MASDIILAYKFNFSKEEHETLDLIRYYDLLCSQYLFKSNSFLCLSKNPKKNNLFKKFKKLVTESKRSGTYIPDPKLWIKAQFEIIKNPEYYYNNEFPIYMIFQDEAFERYSNYINYLFILENNNKPPIDEVNYIKLCLKNTLVFFKKYFKKNYNTSIINFELFFKNTDNNILIENNGISIYFLAVSKSFNKYGNLELFPEINIYKNVYRQNLNLLKFAEDLFGDEINDRFN